MTRGRGLLTTVWGQGGKSVVFLLVLLLLLRLARGSYSLAGMPAAHNDEHDNTVAEMGATHDDEHDNTVAEMGAKHNDEHDITVAENTCST